MMKGGKLSCKIRQTMLNSIFAGRGASIRSIWGNMPREDLKQISIN